MGRRILHILNIDDLGKKWGARVLFLVLLLLNLKHLLIPFGDSNLDPFIEWYSSDLSIADYASFSEMISDMHITSGNLLYLGLSMLLILFNVVCVYVYAGLYVRQMRKQRLEISSNSHQLKPISLPRMYGRIILFILFTVAVLMLFFIQIYILSFIMIFIIPILALIPMFYISGDKGFFVSFYYAFRFVRLYLMEMSILFVGFYATTALLSLVTSALSVNSMTIASVVDAFAFAYVICVMGRAIGFTYFTHESSFFVKPSRNNQTREL